MPEPDTSSAAPLRGGIIKEEGPHLYMSEIVQGMQNGDISSVASALGAAVRTGVSLPDEFLATVKQWMDSRSKSAQASMQVVRMYPPGVAPAQAPAQAPPPAPATAQVALPTQAAPPPPEPFRQGLGVSGGFQQLKQQLENAIAGGNVQAQVAVLQRAAQLAVCGTPAGTMTPSPPVSVASGAMTPFALGGMTPAPSPQPGAVLGGMTPSPPAPMPGADRVLGFGDVTPMPKTGVPGDPTPEFSPTVIPSDDEDDKHKAPVLPTASKPPRPAPPQTPGTRTRKPSAASRLLQSLAPKEADEKKPPELVRQTPLTLRFDTLDFHTTDRKAFKRELFGQFRACGLSEAAITGLKVRLREGSILVEVSGKAEAVQEFKEKVPRRAIVVMGSIARIVEAPSHDEVPTATKTTGASEKTISPTYDDFPAADHFAETDPLGAEVPISQMGEPVTAEAITNFLRGEPGESSNYRKLGLHFKDSEAVRAKIGSMPGSFSVVGDRVTLKDPWRKEALAFFAQELSRKVLMKSRIEPDEINSLVRKAADYAMQAYPEDVVKVLKEISRNVMKRPGPVGKGKYSASMPVALACLVDRVVVLERQRGSARRLENAIGPNLHRMIFKRWQLGVIPGSQFLANILITWERLGYFKVKHLSEPMKSLWLLIAYARLDGIPDPMKDSGEGWYKSVQREPWVLAGCEAIASKQAKLAAGEAPLHVGEQSGRAEAQAMADDQRSRTLKATAQMGLGPADASRAGGDVKRQRTG
mmetsp:Transcript_66540/g.185498  ORF Transcript_66540/g.185498 Transcript_66540/m.185498 type:complete len:755 (-) Transcript_66540:77-2341(-)